MQHSNKTRAQEVGGKATQQPNKTRAQQVIWEIVHQAGGEFIGKPRLYKAFYLAHILYAKNAAGYLTDWPIVRMPNGPGIDDNRALIGGMLAAGVLEKDEVMVWPFQATRYRLTDERIAAEPLDDEAVSAIHQAVGFILPKTGTELSEWTQDFCRAWIEGQNGDELNIYTDLMSDDEYEETRERVQSLHAGIVSVFEG